MLLLATLLDSATTTIASLPTAPLLAWTPGVWEILLIGAAMLLLFGKRLPEVGRSLGKGVVEFKRGLNSVKDEYDSVDVEVRRRGPAPANQKARALPEGDAATAAGDIAPTTTAQKDKTTA